MDIIVSAKNFELTPSLRAYAEEKVGRVARRWDKIIRARIELEVNRGHVSGEVYRAEAVLEVPGPDIRATQQSADMHAAIDLLVEPLERQVARAKSKLGGTWRAVRGSGRKLAEWYGRLRK